MLRAKKLNSPQGTSQSPDLILKEQDFKLLKTKVKPKRLTNYWTWLQYLGENLNGLNTMMVISKVILPWVFVSSLFLNLLEKTRSFIERDYTGVWYIRIICHNLHQIFGNASRIVFNLGAWEKTTGSIRSENANSINATGNEYPKNPPFSPAYPYQSCKGAGAHPSLPSGERQGTPWTGHT